MYNLANELRPQKLDDIVGQKHVINLLKKIVQNKMATSFIFFGESGTGKSSTAIALANEMQLPYGYFNSTTDSKADLLDKIKNNKILIIDEIHRLNKDKQDILLSYLEFDKIIVYATTTENPYFRVNPALRSRMQILQFNKLDEQEIADALENIIKTHFSDLKISQDLILDLARYSSGDYRSSINNLQILALVHNRNQNVTREDLKKIIPNINFYSDMNSSAHYNNLSAFHKSLRGSDVNAALYYGALILKSGDYQGLFRRINAVAYEDIGLANPNIILRVEAAFNSVERLGFPEANLPIAFIITDLALSPKSNSTYLAFSRANQLIDNGKIYDIPKHLRDAHYQSAKKLGDGIGYLYPHDYQFNWVHQTYLPKQLENEVFYVAGKNENEQKYKKYWEQIKNFGK
ncbi:replication-associated recombination protein A [Mycoplasmopsis pullorum]|uniref:AAA family ATPase n=1 Tax=Mycoplasmopsis pullorum TaxID=48003 RepID=A0A1L4FRW2_9BACT|nr:replication-associated recombination protein A [Mycoplasmopsis pullorum]APJ38332.1 AAA family ATPase [Mycoplasmopsis pullorum]TNK82217.1 replication-associated recombination protein A [Mycoplasmopsis pullorum]TNK83131.1 replication-associated recombination protein A [Mycoplasmopsis pullorum]TNK84748.1 replication-associated recombination protein A [Mycoplasmopsis pullorum]TNK85409.1 replication-associated recombination protein A [Mycoplasmopsis pullorum]